MPSGPTRECHICAASSNHTRFKMLLKQYEDALRQAAALPEPARTSTLALLKTFDVRDEAGNAIEIRHLSMPDATGLPSQSDISAMVTKALADTVAKGQAKLERNPLGIDRKSGGIPAEVRRGQLKNFKGDQGHERAFRFGSWALATMGHEKAIGWCADQGIVIAKSQAEGVNSAGGFLVPEILENDLIDLRLEYGVFRAQANVVPMRSDVHTRPRRTGGLTANFVGEGSAGTKSQKTWDAVNLTAKKLMVLAISSTELNEDAIISVGDDLAGEIVYAFSQKEDECGFNGDGTSAYGGIEGVTHRLTSINGVDDGAGLVLGTGSLFGSYALADFHNAVARVPSYARRNAKWYCSPTFNDSVMQTLITALGGTTASDVVNGARAMFLGYPVVLTEVMPTEPADSQVACLFGDLRKAADFGDRRQTTITFATSGMCDGVDLFSTDQVGIRGTERFDINVHDVGNATTAGPVVGLISKAS
jgi:HK97 family phage major capsid protein